MASSAPLRFGVVGSGWRSGFFLRAARQMPDRFACVGVVTRTAESGAVVEQEWGVGTVRTVDELLAARPELVVVSVPWPVTPEVTRELVARGVPVLAETPPAPDADGLRALWADVGSSGLVQVAEHSPSMPAHQARIRLVEDGLIGTPTSVQVSSTHLYHAVGLVRRLLRAGRGEVAVRTSRFTAPLIDPRSRDGWTGETQPQDRWTLLATLDFGDGRSALYDFTENQWHNPLRTNRITVRGSHGEVVGDSVTRWVDEQTIVTSSIVRRASGIEQDLDGFDLQHLSLDGRVLYRNPFDGARLADDDLAVATLLADSGAWVRGDGPPPYPLADGCQDHLLGLAIEESARTGETVRTGREAWADA
ncbi:Gfo/Idh/MocA family protein [Cellulomonas fimi]|uniref:Oxidoreductase domain protein n=1 Tax=Cellulomonas fimi (strain ATCC 484 / DSM 20113 / JCM 1341 / CCUG 24087 / LMG 16345 / NBRC 15513 / NCIMB 8980 / NCTC 7547 / NRS-133) TaxID=590998 RepID=F4H4J3_CELFA|nr:Gfo/Idh/MocA family oxidoreductase [Cellulomonas fimi]AEE47788.1 oxidoreductase domain protein [Cellulomonas fimi ATCC 484]NNH06676.1 Gfo/Idh/MocA family oxidoreductase [Cellulomonas fimi]VEH37003.1 Oxidoreductase family, NAD-binding Rossmann fold [Cellulomonas fimi]